MISFLPSFPLLKEMRCVQEEVAHAYIQKMFAYVVFWEFYGFMTYIQVLDPFWIYFMGLDSDPVSFPYV